MTRSDTTLMAGQISTHLVLSRVSSDSMNISHQSQELFILNIYTLFKLTAFEPKVMEDDFPDFNWVIFMFKRFKMLIFPGVPFLKLT